MLSLWLDSFATNGRAKKTAANYKIILSDILQYGHEKYNLPINPAKNITLPAGMKTQKRKMPDAWQLTTIMQNYETDWVCQIYYIFAFTGMRLGELLALQWRDLDPAEQTISVTKAVYWESTRPMFKAPKTEAGVRMVPYLPHVQAVLEPKRLRNDLYVIHGPRSSGESPMTRTSYYKMLEHAKKIGLTSTPHALRHAFATLCCEYDVDARTAGAIFGWANPSRMEDIYAEIRQKKILHAGELLANAEY